MTGSHRPSTCPLPLSLLCAARQAGVALTRFIFLVDVQSQQAWLAERSWRCMLFPPRFSADTPFIALHDHYRMRRRIRCSTSKFGISQIFGSNGTPLGLHRIAQKIGGGWPVGTVFRGRRPVGFTWHGEPGAPIAHRILWLEGLQDGFNRGGNVDSFRRYIYVHGTGEEPTLGRPASHGCIHLSADDLLPLYRQLPLGTLVWIAERLTAR